MFDSNYTYFDVKFNKMIRDSLSTIWKYILFILLEKKLKTYK